MTNLVLQMVSEDGFGEYLFPQNNTRPFSSLHNSLHKLCQREDPQHWVIKSKIC